MSVHTITQPLRAAVADARAKLTDATDLQPLYLSTNEKEQLLIDVTRLAAQVAELKLRVLATADDIAAQHGTRRAADWLAHATNAEPAAVRVEEKLAHTLDTRYPSTRVALADASINIEQTKVIVHALDALPDHLGSEIKGRAERDLIRLAGDFGPAQLRVLGRSILFHTAPEIADAEEARRLEALENKADLETRLRLRPTGEGTTRLSGMIPDTTAARLATILDAIANPKRPDTAEAETTGTPGTGSTGENPDIERLPLAKRRGQAFVRMLDLIDPVGLPRQAGDATTVMVTVSLDNLTTGLGRATMTNPLSADGTLDISVSHARQLLCRAGVLPAVLGGKGEVLDLGRTRRLFGPAIRKALRLTHATCSGEGCTIPAAWCDAHHLQPWSQGGATSLENATLLCGFHHHRIHDPAYTHEKLPDGSYRFHRRT